MEMCCTPLFKWEFSDSGYWFYQSYSPVAYADYFIINISIVAMHRPNGGIFDVSNEFWDKTFPIHERVCVCPPPNYLDCFEIHYPNFILNRYEGPFCLQYMNGILVTKPSGRKWNQLLDAVVTIIKHKKGTIYHAICIKFLSYGAGVLYYSFYWWFSQHY